MFCPKCGAANPDGSQFCAQCGETFAVQPQTVNQPVQQSQPAEYQPQQPVYQQPQMYQQPYGAQPAFNQPYAQPKVRTPLDPKKKKAIIIASACAAVLAAFLIVLFAAIIPNSGFKGKLRHTWRLDSTRENVVLNLKDNTMTSDNQTSKITNCRFQGNNLTLTSQNPNNPLDVTTQTFICAMTSDGRTLLLFEAEDYDPEYVDYVFIRID